MRFSDKKNQCVRSIFLKQVHHTLEWSIGNVFQPLPSLPTSVIARISYRQAIGCFEGWIDPLACGATRLSHNNNAESPQGQGWNQTGGKPLHYEFDPRGDRLQLLFTAREGGRGRGRRIKEVGKEWDLEEGAAETGKEGNSERPTTWL